MRDSIILVYILLMRRKLFHKNLDHIRVFELCKKREILSKIANERNFNVRHAFRLVAVEQIVHVIFPEKFFKKFMADLPNHRENSVDFR